MHAQSIVELSASLWASSVVLVKNKKDGGSRFYVDYRKLNELTKEDSYPLQRVDTALDALSGSSWLITLYLKSGYWQVEVEVREPEKTAFIAGNGQVPCPCCKRGRGIAVDTDKVEVVTNWPLPQNVSYVRSFLGFNYLLFKPSFTEAAIFLQKLTKDWSIVYVDKGMR